MLRATGLEDVLMLRFLLRRHRRGRVAQPGAEDMAVLTLASKRYLGRTAVSLASGLAKRGFCRLDFPEPVPGGTVVEDRLVSPAEEGAHHGTPGGHRVCSSPHVKTTTTTTPLSLARATWAAARSPAWAARCSGQSSLFVRFCASWSVTICAFAVGVDLKQQ